jgi:hypothetical protein
MERGEVNTWSTNIMFSFFDELFAAFGSKFSSKIGLIPEITSVQPATSGLGIASKQELGELLSDFMDVPENIALVKSIDELPDVKRILGLIEANALKHANIERIKRNTAIVEHLATCKNCGHDESEWTAELKQAVNHCRNMFSPEFQAAMKGDLAKTWCLANKQISIYKATFEWLSFCVPFGFCSCHWRQRRNLYRYLRGRSSTRMTKGGIF